MLYWRTDSRRGKEGAVSGLVLFYNWDRVVHLCMKHGVWYRWLAFVVSILSRFLAYFASFSFYGEETALKWFSDTIWQEWSLIIIFWGHKFDPTLWMTTITRVVLTTLSQLVVCPRGGLVDGFIKIPLYETTRLH